MNFFFRQIRIEFFKTKRTSTIWTAIILGALLPVVSFLFRWNYPEKARKEFIQTLPGSKIPINIKPFWEAHFNGGFQTQSAFFMPMLAIIAASLIIQLEVKNNTWKQTLTTPVNYITIFFSKLIVVFSMQLLYFLSYFVMMLASGYLLGVVDDSYLVSKDSPDLTTIFYQIGRFMFFLSPILILHFWLSIRFKNPFVSIGFGLCALVISLVLQAWEYYYNLPHIYPFFAGRFQYFNSNSKEVLTLITRGTWIWSGSLLVLSLLDFVSRKERG